MDIIDMPGTMEQYEEMKLLGEGCFAKVGLYKVRRTDKKVALKMIDLSKIEDPAAMKCVEQEFELARKLLLHSKIVKTHTTFHDLKGNQLIIVLEYMQNGDLERYIHYHFLAMNQLLPEYRVWRFIEQIADAIAFMHKKKIIHRDLKPANVMLGLGGVVKVGDFGLSRLKSTMTQEVKTVCGTPYYMSPERINQRGYTYASDVWSMGCILYEMSSGVSPFFGERHNSYSLSNKVDKAEYPPTPENCYSPFLIKLIALCLTPDFADRPQAKDVHEYAYKMMKFFDQKRRETKS